ncbi:unnamed protein product [Schistosoma curassoni]|uniref:Endonuclease-reverse transcriptase n=1 Tax=Schistosoma curassoni TaxID=6186 RepID=A0A183K8V4_9TREM|nr:unnamed protein product [Schistosoma curassoni]
MSYYATVRSVLIYGSETWPLRVHDTRKLLVFDHRCLRNIASVCWDHRISNSEVRHRVLGNDGKSVDEVVNLHRLRAVRSILHYGSETWPVRVEDIPILLVFDHRCLQSIARISWDHRVSNAVVRIRVLGKDGKSIDEVVKLHQLRWLGHVLRMPNDRLPRRAMFYDVGVGWEKAKGGQTKTWNKFMNSLTSGRCRLPGWDPRDDSNRWLETLNDMAQNRLQWRRCIHSLCSPKF